ncbi:MAG: alpha/beta fold hydrolase [Erythrobacter sp.]
MATIALRIVIMAAIVYAALLALLYANQDRMIFPASQERHAPTAGFEAVTLTTSDDLELVAHWRKPEAGKPTLVWFHGNAGSLAGSAQETALMASHGYGVLLASYRGYGSNPGSPSEEGFYRDGRAAMAFLKEAGIDLSKTVIAGNSIGTGTAVEMAREFEPAALILVAPFTALTDVAGESLPYVPVSWFLNHRFDNLAKLPQISSPTLVLHGTADQVVPFAHGEALGKVAPKGTFLAFDGVGHTLGYQMNAQREEERWLESLGL